MSASIGVYLYSSTRTAYSTNSRIIDEGTAEYASQEVKEGRKKGRRKETEKEKSNPGQATIKSSKLQIDRYIHFYFIDTYPGDNTTCLQHGSLRSI